MLEQKRLTAVKIRIRDINNGKYNIEEGFTPNYILTSDGRKISRVRVLGTAVSVFESEDAQFNSITIDDGTDTIRVKTFKGMKLLKSFNNGDLLDVIGKVREYNGEIYIIPEIVHKVDDFNFETLRMLEIIENENEWKKKIELVKENKDKMGVDELKKYLSDHHGIKETEVESIISVISSPKPEEKKENYELKVLEIINKLDDGEGASYSDIITESGLSESIVDSVVNQLLMDGICFEPRPGRIKKL